MNSNSNLGSQLNDGATSMLDATSKAADNVMNSMSTEAHNLVARGSRALQDSTTQVRKQAEAARDATRDYIQQDPMKAVLFAAAAGAALVLLGSLLTRNSRD